MIDDIEKAEALIQDMRAALPRRATLDRDVPGSMRRKSPDETISARCEVIDVHYGFDEGGILCVLDLGADQSKTASLVSITHLRFDRADPLWRRIEGYKRRRLKRLRKLHGAMP